MSGRVDTHGARRAEKEKTYLPQVKRGVDWTRPHEWILLVNPFAGPILADSQQGIRHRLNGQSGLKAHLLYWAATGCTATLPSTCQPQGLLNAERVCPADRRGAHALQLVCNNLLPNT